jgi:hypothetical protein
VKTPELPGATSSSDEAEAPSKFSVTAYLSAAAW